MGYSTIEKMIDMDVFDTSTRTSKKSLTKTTKSEGSLWLMLKELKKKTKPYQIDRFACSLSTNVKDIDIISPDESSVSARKRPSGECEIKAGLG